MMRRFCDFRMASEISDQDLLVPVGIQILQFLGALLDVVLDRGKRRILRLDGVEEFGGDFRVALPDADDLAYEGVGLVEAVGIPPDEVGEGFDDGVVVLQRLVYLGLAEQGLGEKVEEAPASRLLPSLHAGFDAFDDTLVLPGCLLIELGRLELVPGALGRGDHAPGRRDVRARRRQESLQIIGPDGCRSPEARDEEKQTEEDPARTPPWTLLEGRRIAGRGRAGLHVAHWAWTNTFQY